MFSRRVRSAALAVSTLLAAATTRADVAPAPLFSAGAVLQRDRALPVWGRATPGERVTVAFAGQTIGTVTGADGRWIVFLAPLAATAAGADLTIAGNNTVVVREVVVGDVWLCAGGANMAAPLAARPVPAPAGRPSPIPADLAALRLPLIRQWRPPAGPDSAANAGAAASSPGGESAWQPAVPPALGAFSAVGFAFARELQTKIGVPLGLIAVAAAGTPIETWLPPSPESGAGALYAARLAPLLPAALRGVLWYHGEEDVGRAAAYHPAFLALVAGWRTQFAQPELPFFWVNLAGHAPAADHLARGRSWAHLRDAQTRALALPHTAQAVAIDLAADPKNVLAVDHAEVGRRLALLARRRVFGATLDDSGPVFAAATREGAALRVTFDHADTGLIAHGKPMGAVEIAGADRVFHVAQVRLERDTLLASSPAVPAPVAVRYAWSNAPDANLFNGAGLPALPFRSDNW